MQANILIAQPASKSHALTVKDLSLQLTSSLKTDLEKTKAIFRWVAVNIEYNTRTFGRNKGNYFADFSEPEDSSAILPPLVERVAASVLRKRTAVCDGYCKLFKALCDAAGIRCEIISGYADGNFGRSKFKSNHSWNAVYIDSNWHLLDVTWASGYVNPGGNFFIANYNENYFFTSPEIFIRDHYPEDLKWTLLENPPAIHEFRQSPFRYSSFTRQRITAFAPSRGIIECSLGDTLEFKIESLVPVAQASISELPAADSTVMEETADRRSGQQTIQYIVTQAVDWLYVNCNGEPVLRYKINLKKNAPAVAKAD